MKTFRDIYNLVYQIELMTYYGYSGPEIGADGHKTFTNRVNPEIQILVDLPGNEWHLMVKGVVHVVGKLNDESLRDILSGNITAAMEYEETDDERLARAKTYEPDGGTSSSSDNTSSSAGTHN
jgi:hypothetical protein